MTAEVGQLVLRASDLRQYVYCPRVIYFKYCVPVKAPPTYKMVEGKLQHERIEELEHRRTLRAYGLADGERYFDVRLESERLGISGTMDMVILRRYEVIPVEFKNVERAEPEPGRARKPGRGRASGEPGEDEDDRRPVVDLHHKYQLAAYALLAEERWERPARRCFVYPVMARQAIEVEITQGVRKYVSRLLGEMRTMIVTQLMPPGTRRLGRCRECEYLRFCNDVDF